MNTVELSFNFSINFLSIIKSTATKMHLTHSQALCVCAIPFNGISQSDLANKLSIDISTLSRNLEKLIKLNIISKTNSYLDRRSYKIQLTDNGVEVYNDFIFLIQSQLKTSYEKLSLDEIESLEDILNKLNWELSLLKK